ncbi:methionine biosynthesis protein MetW [Arenibaculum pallidiluteum]|uniref:methionine biosynthesis protein MetW n=1 Tax=Arenibaculum pallidiluteum TaxID=2812559 RepID=UPI001A958E25|nr:methionine biosynthesis protein MetW [Arenibaculum pallidiluteum]
MDARTGEGAAQGHGAIRPDLRLVAEMVTPGSRVLDVGCGDGALLHHLVHERQVDGRGIELSMDGVRQCVSQGLSVIQGDAEADLADYPDDSFDFVVLSQTLQAMRDPRRVLLELVRIGRHAVVSLPNFGYWRVRMSLLWGGRMPVTKRLGYAWWETPNIHLCTIRDFLDLCADVGVRIDRTVILGRHDRPTRAHPALNNLIGEQGIFLLSRK